jgi:dTDP-4-amino-4,6-dideoxygalactose transaminase
MVTTSTAEVARTIRLLRDWGAEKKYMHVLKGYNMRLEGMQGAILRVKLRYLEQWTEARRAAAKRYNELFAGSPIAMPFAPENKRHVYHIFSTRTTERQRWQDALLAKGVQTGIHYPIAIHNLPAYEDLGYKRGDFPHAERAAAEQLSLPMYPEMTADMQEQVAAAVVEVAKAGGLSR